MNSSGLNLAGRGLQRAQRARLLTVGIRLGQPGLAHVPDQHAPAREHLHQPGDDGVQQRVQFLVGGCTRLDETGHAIGTAALHAVQDQAVQPKIRFDALREHAGLVFQKQLEG